MRWFQQLNLFDRIRGRQRLGRPKSSRIQSPRLRAPAPSAVRRREPIALGAGSAPELLEVWCALRLRFFPERVDLDSYTIGWSRRRQKRTLASCNMRSRCVIVAQELRDPLFNEWIEPILHHELCHAVIGLDVARRKGRRAWHGREFRSLENLHPRIPALDDWIKNGGWLYAVRRARGLTQALKDRSRKSG